MSGLSSNANRLIAALMQNGSTAANAQAIAASVGNCGDAFGPQNGPAEFNGPTQLNGPTSFGPYGSANFNGRMNYSPQAAEDTAAAIGPFLPIGRVQLAKASGAIPKSGSGSVVLFTPSLSGPGSDVTGATISDVIVRDIPDGCQIPNAATVVLGHVEDVDGNLLPIVLSSYPCYEQVP